MNYAIIYNSKHKIKKIYSNVPIIISRCNENYYKCLIGNDEYTTLIDTDTRIDMEESLGLCLQESEEDSRKYFLTYSDYLKRFNDMVIEEEDDSRRSL